MRESPATYDIEMDLRAAFGDVPMVSLSRVASYLRKDRRTLMGDKEFIKVIRPVGKRKCVVTKKLARWMAAQNWR